MAKIFGTPSVYATPGAEANVGKGLTLAELSGLEHGARLVVRSRDQVVGTLRKIANNRETGQTQVSLVSDNNDGYVKLDLPHGGGFLERKRRKTPTFFYAIDVESGDVSEDFKVAELMIGEPTAVPGIDNRYELILTNAEGTQRRSIPLGEVDISVDLSIC